MENFDVSMHIGQFGVPKTHCTIQPEKKQPFGAICGD
jgi:hypothetical protein